MNQISICCKNISWNLEILSFLFNTCEANDIAKKNIVEPFVEILKRASNLKKLCLSFGFLILIFLFNYFILLLLDLSNPLLTLMN